MFPTGLLLAVAFGQVPTKPVIVRPLQGLARLGFEPILATPQTGVTASVWEFRPTDAGWTCAEPGSCPPRLTMAPLFQLTPSVADGAWCVRVSFENADGRSLPSDPLCFLEDGQPPLPPVILDAGLAQPGVIFVHSQTPPDLGLAGLDKVCAGAAPADGGPLLTGFCRPSVPWYASGALDSGVLFTAVGPGRWRPSVGAVDFAANASGDALGSMTLDVVATHPAPPAPTWALPDGGTGAANIAVSDRYFTSLRFAGLPGTQFLVTEERVGDGGYVAGTVSVGLSNVSQYRRSVELQRFWHYAVVLFDGGVSAWSDDLPLRLDLEAPSSIENCLASQAGGLISVRFDGGVDAQTATRHLLTATAADGGVLVSSSLSLLAGEGRWAVEAQAIDEAENSTAPGACGSVTVDLTAPSCSIAAAPALPLAVRVDVSCRDDLSTITAIHVFRQATDGLNTALDAGSSFIDTPGAGTFRYGVTAEDVAGNVGAPVWSQAITLSAPLDPDAGSSEDAGRDDAGAREDAGQPVDAGPVDAGARQDAGLPDAGSKEDAGPPEDPRPGVASRRFSVSCGCDGSGVGASLVLLVLAWRRRR